MSDAAGPDSLWPQSLKRYDVSLATAAENIALDEALLAAVDADAGTACLRFWRPADHLVVLGRSNQAASEVDLAVCDARNIPILRRSSGGGTVLIGPGCLCFSLVFPQRNIHRSLGVSNVTAQLMSRTAAGLRALIPGIEVRGTSDLVWNDRKFSGNAQRWLKHAFIHHGTLLFNFDLLLLESCLSHPSREPAYRQFRSHSEFVTNLPVDERALQDCLCTIWNAQPADCPSTVVDAARQIAASRDQSGDWRISSRP
jgi:lipoate-protein ligase A